MKYFLVLLLLLTVKVSYACNVATDSGSITLAQTMQTKRDQAWLIAFYYLALINPINFVLYTLLPTPHPFTDCRTISFKPFPHLS